MTIEKNIVIDKIEILESGIIQVRQATKLIEDGNEIARCYHRHVLAPGDSLDGQTKRVIAVAKAVWSDDLMMGYITNQEAK